MVNGASVLWTAFQPGTGTVTVTDASGQSNVFLASTQAFQPSLTGLGTPYYQFQADITGLQSGSTYSYRVTLNGQDIGSDPTQFHFTTPTPGKFSFLVFGDSGADSPEQHTLIQRMAAEQGISKVIHVGDMAYMNGTFAQFEANYFALNAPLMSRLPFFATPGNHEYETADAAAFVAGHAMPASNVPTADLGRYYSFDWGDAHFTSIDSNLLSNPAAAGRMLAWLDNDLSSSSKYWKIVFLHHPPYPTGMHLSDPLCALVRQNVNPIVERNGVQLVLTGHEHGYERSWPVANDQRVQSSGQSTTYVITGGGGGAMEEIGSLPQCAVAIQAFHYLRVDVNGAQLSLSAIGLDGTVIDTFSLAPPPALTVNAVVSVGDGTPSVATGSLASIFGQNLAPRSSSTPGLPLAMQLGGITVTANGQPVPLLYASPVQLNIQIPYEVSGDVILQVTTPNGSATTGIHVVPVAPSIIAVIAQNSLCSASNPATQGGNVTVYITGLGAPISPAITGQAAPPAANAMAAAVQVWLDNTSLQPMYAGLAPGFAGLSQVNFAVPAGCQNGVYALRIAAGTASSQATNLTVGSSSNAPGKTGLVNVRAEAANLQALVTGRP